MSRLRDVVLAATLHDPPGALAGMLSRLVPALASLYGGVVVATSPPTSPRLRRRLEQLGMHAGTPRTNLRGPLYRLALRAALRTGVDRVHYLDLDRALHWLLRTPREYRGALRAAARHPVLVLGRTPKAHRSHHLPLHATETVANRLIAARLGLSGRLDVLVPSFVLARPLVERLLAGSRARDTALYGEWAALLFGLAPDVAYLECRGLDWETPDRDPRGVRRLGLAAWRARFDTPAEWSLRIAMAREFVRGFSRARTATTRVRLRRLPTRH